MPHGTSDWWPTVGVMLGGLTVALNSGVLNVAIPSMMSSLSTDLDRIQWVQTSFQIIQAVLIPAVGWLGARLGTKRLFILSPSSSSPARHSLGWLGTCTR
jgi:MFS family permease